jgi:hypothetical protein
MSAEAAFILVPTGAAEVAAQGRHLDEAFGRLVAGAGIDHWAYGEVAAPVPGKAFYEAFRVPGEAHFKIRNAVAARRLGTPYGLFRFIEFRGRYDDDPADYNATKILNITRRTSDATLVSHIPFSDMLESAAHWRDMLKRGEVVDLHESDGVVVLMTHWSAAVVNERGSGVEVSLDFPIGECPSVEFAVAAWRNAP